MNYPKKTRTRSRSTNNPTAVVSTLSEKNMDNPKEEKVDNASNTVSSGKDSGETVVPPSENTNCENAENQGVVNSVKTRKRKASEAELDAEGDVTKDSNNAAENDADAVTNKAEESAKDIDSSGTEKASKANESESSQDSDSKGDTTFEKADSADSSMMEQNEITFGRSGTILGKGKRARIPNKRYSDIILTPPSRTSKTVSENGEKRNLEKMETDKIETETFDSADSPAVVSLKRTSMSSPFSKKPKLSVDLSNPNFTNPFKYGWKRELVYRATNDASNRRNADIYYYTPSGKKVRSMREVAEHLHESGELKMEDFTFFKEPLGLNDPEKEIIRDAKIKIGGGGTPVPKKSTSLTPAKVKPFKAISPRVKAATPKSSLVKSPATPKPTVHAQSSTSSAQSDLPSEEASKLGNFKIKLPPKKGEKKQTPDENMKVEKESPLRSGKRPAKSNDDNKPCQPCSIRCPEMLGMVPTLQCRLCLCLYHHRCVGKLPGDDHQLYVCKNCDMVQQPPAEMSSPTPLSPPPPLTPIMLLKSSHTNTNPMVLPKLQRIPKPKEDQKTYMPPEKLDNSPIISLENVSVCLSEKPRKLSPKPKETLPNEPKQLPVKPSEDVPQSENKSLVGSVTTWLPHSSKIQVDTASQKRGLSESSRPQFVEYLGGRKYLVIPKQNVISVCPSGTLTRPEDTADAATSKPEDTVNTAESAGNSVVNKEPVHSASFGITGTGTPKTEPGSPTPTAEPGTDNGSCKDVEEDGEKNKRKREEDEKGNLKGPMKKRATARLNSTSLISDKRDDSKFMVNYLQHLSYGYNTLLYVFQYLKVQDLLRAGCVCTMWKDLASHSSLWKTVRMKNSPVHSFDGLANTLKEHGTKNLDLRKMLLPNGGEETWPEFNKSIAKVTTLRKIELCRCPASVIEQLSVSNPDLEIVNALAIKCESMNLDPLGNFTGLKELRLKSTSGLSLSSDLTALKQLNTLRHLSLTSIRDLNKLNLEMIAELTNLDSLDLGECMNFPENFGKDIIAKLPKLEKLRLEKGQGTCHIFEILEAIKDMPQLEQLELVNFDIKAGFDKALGKCSNIKRLLIIPTYISQSATTNHMVLGGVLRLQKTLSHFVWGVTLELLRVTEIFVDQCEEPDKKDKKQDKGKEKEKEKKPTGTGDSIPVLKPVPVISDKDEIPPAHDPPQVEILPLPNLQKLLLQSLPTTRVKILKIPFHATWRQSITDSVN